MARARSEIRWSQKVPRELVQRLYEADAAGIENDDLLNEVAMGLYARCQSIMDVTRVHNMGILTCPRCGTDCRKRDGRYACDCGFEIDETAVHKTYQGKQLYGANATHIFENFLNQYPLCRTYKDKLLEIDRLIHAFHSEIERTQAEGRNVTERIQRKEDGRPVAANLLEGNLADVIGFLDRLTQASGQCEWSNRIRGISWAGIYFKENRINAARSR